MPANGTASHSEDAVFAGNSDVARRRLRRIPVASIVAVLASTSGLNKHCEQSRSAALIPEDKLRIPRKIKSNRIVAAGLGQVGELE
jgi:hypothetical protein